MSGLRVSTCSRLTCGQGTGLSANTFYPAQCYHFTLQCGAGRGENRVLTELEKNQFLRFIAVAGFQGINPAAHIGSRFSASAGCGL